VGIDPEPEAAISFIGNSITQGRFLKPDDQLGIVVGGAFADKFETRLGRKIVLMSQGADKELSSKAFKIVGIFRSEMESTEKQFVFITKGAAAKLLKIKSGVSEFSILLPEQIKEQAEFTAAEIREGLSRDYSVETWQELLPMIDTYMKLIDGWIYIWNLVVFIAMGFGIVNTLLMAVFERMREFGLVKALGTKASWIVRDVLTESFLLLIAGMGIGNLVGWGTVAALSKTGINLSALSEGTEYFGMPRILYPAFTGKDVIIANLTVVILGLLISLYPAIKAARCTPVEAMAHT
jgi:ABC-type lipoprotein release transport system permease subunit